MLRWRGTMHGREVEGTVQAGALFGPLEVRSLVEALVSEGVRVGFGPWTGAADLTHAVAARAVIAAVLDDGSATFAGMDPPAPEPVPAGAET